MLMGCFLNDEREAVSELMLWLTAFSALVQATAIPGRLAAEDASGVRAMRATCVAVRGNAS
jgi:hypothetical protein